MYAPFLINFQWTNIFDMDLHKMTITTLVFNKVFLRDQISAETSFPTDNERNYCQVQLKYTTGE